MSYNEIGDEGAKALAAGIQDAQLRRLLLSGNDAITAEGARALARALRYSNIELLLLSDIEIRDEAGQAFVEQAKDTAITELQISGCSEQTLEQIDEVLEANWARSFVLQMQVEGDETQWTFTFRTAAGTVAAVLTWSSDRPAYELPEAVFTAMGTSGFQLLTRHLRAHNLRIVRPDGNLLEDSADAPDLAQQLAH